MKGRREGRRLYTDAGKRSKKREFYKLEEGERRVGSVSRECFKEQLDSTGKKTEQKYTRDGPNNAG